MDPNRENMEVDEQSGVPQEDGVMDQQPPAESGGPSYNLTGGYYNKPHFGQKVEVHHHYHGVQGRTTSDANPQDQPGTSRTGPPGQQQPRRRSGQEPGDPDEILMVPPQPPLPNDGDARKLTDAIMVYMKCAISKKPTGNVYPGIQNMGPGGDRDIAVKVVKYNPIKKREAINLMKLGAHSNVVLVIQSGVHTTTLGKHIYIAMEQCQTLTLEKYYEEKRKDKVPFNTKQALEFARQVIDGINHIHSKDIIHRDLKPSSILFSQDGKSLKIIDFGVSKELEQGLTTMSVSTKIGTDGFRAPETYLKNEIKKCADVFALGILVYYILSYGHHPFNEEATLWAHHIKKGYAPDFSRLLIPEAKKAKDMLSKMLQFDYNKRCDIREVMDHEFIRQGVDRTLLSEMDDVWAGSVKVKNAEDAQPFDCKMYERIGSDTLGIKGQDADFQLVYVPLTRMRSIKEGITSERPQGYMAVSKSIYLRRLRKQFIKQMGWINVFRSQDRIGSFIIFQPKGNNNKAYEELVCVYIEDPEEFLNRLRVASHADETTVPKEIAPEPEVEADMILPTIQPTDDDNDSETFQTAVNNPSSSHDLLRAIKGDYERKPEGEEEDEEEDGEDLPEMPAPDRKIEIGQPEYISWWIYRAASSSGEGNSQPSN